MSNGGRSHEPGRSILGTGATSKSCLLPPQSAKMLSCFRPQCLKNKTFFKSHCKHKNVDGNTDHQQPPKTNPVDKNLLSLKRELLMREVVVLENQLENEQVMHKALMYEYQQDPGRPISKLPSFLLPEVKELLSEMHEVDKDISRLERQINELRVDLAVERLVTASLKSRKDKKKCDGKNKLGRLPMLEVGLNLKYN